MDQLSLLDISMTDKRSMGTRYQQWFKTHGSKMKPGAMDHVEFACEMSLEAWYASVCQMEVHVQKLEQRIRDLQTQLDEVNHAAA